MKNDNSNVFSTYDLALASALVSYGFSISGIEKTQYGGRSSFIFDRNKELEQAIQAYWSDQLQVNPKAYFDVLKHIKTRLYSGV